MISKALVKMAVGLSPQKARVVAKSLRGSQIESAVNNRSFQTQKHQRSY